MSVALPRKEDLKVDTHLPTRSEGPKSKDTSLVTPRSDASQSSEKSFFSRLRRSISSLPSRTLNSHDGEEVTDIESYRLNGVPKIPIELPSLKDILSCDDSTNNVHVNEVTAESVMAAVHQAKALQKDDATIAAVQSICLYCKESTISSGLLDTILELLTEQWSVEGLRHHIAKCLYSLLHSGSTGNISTTTNLIRSCISDDNVTIMRLGLLCVCCWCRDELYVDAVDGLLPAVIAVGMHAELFIVNIVCQTICALVNSKHYDVVSRDSYTLLHQTLMRCDALETRAWIAKTTYTLALFDPAECSIELSQALLESCLKDGKEDKLLVLWGCRAIGAISYSNEQIRSIICTSDTTRALEEAYNRWKNDADCVAAICWMIANISRFSASNQVILADSKAIEILIESLDQQESADVISEVCISIQNLSANAEALNVLVSSNVANRLLEMASSTGPSAVYVWAAVASLAAHADCRRMYIENGIEVLLSNALNLYDSSILTYRSVVQCLSVMVHEGTPDQVKQAFNSADLYIGCARILGMLLVNDIYTSSLLCSLIEKLSEAEHIGVISSSPLADVLVKACIRWASVQQESALLCDLNALISLSKDAAIVQRLASGGLCKALPKFLTAFTSNSLLLLSCLQLIASMCEAKYKGVSDKLVSAGLLDCINSLFQLHKTAVSQGEEIVLSDASNLVICTIYFNIITTKQFFKQLRRSNTAAYLVDMLESSSNDVVFAACNALAVLGENSDCRAEVSKVCGVRQLLRLIELDDNSPLKALSSLLVDSEVNCAQLIDADGISVLAKKLCHFTEVNVTFILLCLLNGIQYCFDHTEYQDELQSISETYFVEALCEVLSTVRSVSVDTPIVAVVTGVIALLTSDAWPHSDSFVNKLNDIGFVDQLVKWERSISCDSSVIVPILRVLLDFCRCGRTQQVGEAGAMEATCMLLQTTVVSPSASILCINLLTVLSKDDKVMAMRAIALGGVDDILSPLQARFPENEVLCCSLASCVRSLYLCNNLADPPLSVITLLLLLMERHSRSEAVVAGACEALGVIAVAYQVNIVTDKILRPLIRSLQRYPTSLQICIALCTVLSHVGRSDSTVKVLQDTAMWELLCNMMVSRSDEVVFISQVMEALSIVTRYLMLSADCVRPLIGSPLVRSKTLSHGFASVKNLCEGVVAALRNYDSVVDVAIDALDCIYHLAEIPECRAKFVVAGACPLVVEYVRNQDATNALSAALRSLSGLARDGENLEAFSACAGAEAIASVCSSYPSDTSIAIDACRAIVNFTSSGDAALANRVTFGGMGVCEYILNILKEQLQNERLFCHGVLCVGSLSLSMVGNATQFAAGGILDVIATGIQFHNESVDVRCAVARCWKNLATQGVYANQFALLHIPIVKMMKDNLNDCDIVYFCSMALAALSDHGQDSCNALYESGVSKLLADALQRYSETNLAVTVEILSALASLCHNHADISKEVVELELPMLIVNIMKLYSTHEALLIPACQVIQFAPSKRCAEAIVSMMQDNVRSDNVLELGCRTIASLCGEEAMSNLLLDAGVCEALYKSMCRATGDSFAFLQKNNGNTSLAESACLAAYFIAQDKHHVQLLSSAGICEAIVKVLSKFSECENVYIAACKAACALCSHCSEAQNRCGGGSLGKIIINAVEYHGQNPAVAMWGCRTLEALILNNETYNAKLGPAGGCRCVANAVMRHQNSRSVISSGLSALGAFASVASNCYNLGDAGACELTVTGLQEYGTDELVAVGGCRAIGNLSRNPGNCAWLGASGACPCILRVLEKHSGSVNVAVEAWKAVSIMCATNAGCRGRFGQLDACLKAVEAIRYYSSNGDGLAICSICPAIENMALDRGNLTKLLTHGVVDALFEALNATTCTAIEQALFSVLSALCRVTDIAQNAVIACNGISIVFAVLSRGGDVVGGCNALCAMCLNHSPNRNAVRDVGGCSVLVNLLLDEGLGFAAHISVCQAVTCFCDNEPENKRQCGRDGMIVPLFLLSSGGDSALAAAALQCIASLEIDENIPRFMEAGASPTCLALMQSWGGNASVGVSEVILAVIRVVCIINCTGFKHEHVLPVIVRAMQMHDKSSELAVSWLQLINLLARNSVEMQMLLCAGPLPKLIVKMVSKYITDENVAVEACRATTSLTHEHPEAQAKCQEAGFSDMLERLKTKHVTSDRVRGYVGAAELALGTPIVTTSTRFGALFKQFSRDT